VRAGNKNEPLLANEQFLQLTDEATILAARDLDDLVLQLRRKYSDDRYERRLFEVRDSEAERRRANAVNDLRRIIVRPPCIAPP
jgi:hypothetical protein